MGVADYVAFSASDIRVTATLGRFRYERGSTVRQIWPGSNHTSAVRPPYSKKWAQGHSKCALSGLDASESTPA